MKDVDRWRGGVSAGRESKNDVNSQSLALDIDYKLVIELLGIHNFNTAVLNCHAEASNSQPSACHLHSLQRRHCPSHS